MEGVEIDGAGVASIPTAMVDLQLVRRVEEPSTGGAASALLFDQGGPARTARRGLPSAFPPRHPRPLIRTPLACAFRVSQTGGVTMGGEGRLTRTGGWRGTHLAGFPAGPGPVRHPPCRCVGVSSACPGAQLHPGETIQATKGRVTSPGAIVIGPPADCGGELVEQGRLGPVLTSPNDATQRRELFLHLGLGRCQQGCVPETLRAPRSCTRLVCPHPIWTDGATAQGHSRLIACQGVAHLSFADGQWQPDPRQPGRQELLTGIASSALRVAHPAVLGVSDTTGCRIELGDGLVHPMHSKQREERRTAAAWRGPCQSGPERVRCDAP